MQLKWKSKETSLDYKLNLPSHLKNFQVGNNFKVKVLKTVRVFQVSGFLCNYNRWNYYWFKDLSKWRSQNFHFSNSFIIFHCNELLRHLEWFFRCTIRQNREKMAKIQYISNCTSDFNKFTHGAYFLLIHSIVEFQHLWSSFFL